jgi:hypothetical protein
VPLSIDASAFQWKDSGVISVKLHGFKPIFRTMILAIISSGFYPRCALDATDGAEIRVSKIAQMIGDAIGHL